VFFWTAQILLARGFYATQVTWLPSLIGGLISVSVIPLYEWMAEHYAHRGLALAGSIGIGIYTTILAIMLVIRLKWAKRQFSLRPFVQFFLAWSVALVPLTGLGHWIRTWGIYHGTRLSGLAELTVATVILSLVTWVLLRRVFQKLTEGPLY
jgi:peptidoglycan biosynthesis protein MviN/MurJ (putative lipid II flippase)